MAARRSRRVDRCGLPEPLGGSGVMSADNSPFFAVTHTNPCVACGKPDWCRRSADGAHECHRCLDEFVNGYTRIAITPKGFSVYRAATTGGSPKPNARREMI